MNELTREITTQARAYLQQVAPGMTGRSAADTMTTRLDETLALLRECHKLTTVLGERLVGPVPEKPGTGEIPTPGIAGMTMALRSEVVVLRQRLEEIVAGL